MNPGSLGRSLGIAVLAIALTLGAGKALALNVLTFDIGNPGRNSTVGALGFSVTQVGASSVSGLDFGAYDVIYVAQSYEEFLANGSLVLALGSRLGDINEFLANGGGLVFGSPAVGGASPRGITALNAASAILAGVDVSSLSLPPLPCLPGTGAAAEGAGGQPAAVPEPGTYALFGLGLAALAFARRKRVPSPPSR